MIDNHNSLQMHPLLSIYRMEEHISVQFRNWMPSVQEGTLQEGSYTIDIGLLSSLHPESVLVTLQLNIVSSRFPHIKSFEWKTCHL